MCQLDHEICHVTSHLNTILELQMRHFWKTLTFKPFLFRRWVSFLVRPFFDLFLLLMKLETLVFLINQRLSVPSRLLFWYQVVFCLLKSLNNLNTKTQVFQILNCRSCREIFTMVFCEHILRIELVLTLFMDLLTLVRKASLRKIFS